MWRRQIARNIMLCLLAAILFFPPSQAALNELKLPDNIQCACVGDVLTFTCTIVGGGNTIWRGSAFVCPSTTNEIILRHSTFGTTGTSGTCNSGTIVGQSFGVEDTCFTSRLNVTVSESLNSRAVQCDHNSNTGTRNIGSDILNVVSASNPYPPPNDVSLISTNQSQVTFNWTSVSSSCPTIDYVITSDCGVCPSSTNSTTVTCSDLQLPTQPDDSVCSFNVSSRVCGIVGSQTTAILTAAVPDVPRVLSIVPQYANESQSLKRLTLTIDINNTRITTNDISGPITEYNVTYSTPFTLVDSTVIPADSLSCGGDACTLTAAVPTYLCSSSSDINVTLSAANRIGEGPLSDIFIIDCINMFVRVYFNSSTSIFSCDFLNQVDDSVKSCEITVDQGLTLRGQTTPGNPNIVLLDLSDLEGGTYSYTVMARSNVTTIEIEGTFTIKGARENVNKLNLALILGIIVPVVAVFFLIVLVTAVFILINCRKRKSRDITQPSREYELMDNYDTLKPLKLKQIKGRKIRTFKVTQNCSLREGFENLEPKITSWKGHVFYELTDEEEDITDDKELILQKKDRGKPSEAAEGTPVDKQPILKEEETGKSLTPSIDSIEVCQMGYKGAGITRSKFGDMYRVFVQSKGSGARHLARGSFILYEDVQKGPNPNQNVLPGQDDANQHASSGQKGLRRPEGQKKEVENPQSLMLEGLPRWPVPSEYFVTKQLLDEDGATLKEFRDKLGLRNRKYNTFLEYSQLDQEFDITDILLMDKENGKLYTVQFDQHNVKLEKPAMESQKWRVLVLSKFKDNLSLKKNMWVAYEDPNCVRGIFRVLDVDEDNVRMSEFVRRKLGSFEKGKLFYEFDKKEDLICCRKTIRVTKATLQQSRKVHELDATIETFYVIPGVPGKEIMPPDLSKGNRDFIHSPSQSSRCLKKGTTLLYWTNFKSLDQAPEEVGQESSADPEKSSSESKHQEGGAKQISMRESDLCKKLKLKPITGRSLKTYKIDKSCALVEMVTQLQGVKNWRGNAFYQLTNEEEDITDDKDIILQKQDTKKYFRPGMDSKTLIEVGLCGERITKGIYGDEYIIFVQSKGSGARHLAAGTFLLYDHDEKEKIDSDNIPLLPYQKIPSDYFIIKEIDYDGTTLKQLCVQYNLPLNINNTRNNVYLEFSPSEHDLGSEEIRDILLMAKDGKLYTGPVALLNRPGAGSDVDQKWRYFALKKFDENLVLKQNQQVLFENPEYINAMFHVRKVEEENIRMSVFVKNNFGSFERGRAFYEFIQKEDLLFWTKAIRMKKGNIKSPKPEDSYEATAEVFYDIPGTPGMGISPPEYAHIKVLLQSTSLGSRCLKKGTYLLYSCKDLKYEDRETNKLMKVI